MLGRTHPLVRRVLELRREAREREREGVFVAEGVHLAQEALRSGASIEVALVSPAARANPEGLALLALLGKAGVRIEEVAERTLDSLQDARSPQPFLLVVRRRVPELEAVLEKKDAEPLVVVAHCIQDPGNLGAIVRTADAAGASGLVATGGGADLHHPRAVRATMGSIFRLPCLSADLELLLAALERHAIRSYATGALRGEDHDRCDFRGPVALVLGTEGKGLPEEIALRLDATLRIPMREGVSSLSVGAAAAVLLFEASRQRRARPF